MSAIREVPMRADGGPTTAPFLIVGCGRSGSTLLRVMLCHRRWAASYLRERILQVRHEELVLETEATLQHSFQFMGEEFEPQMLSWERKVDEPVPARQRHIHTQLKRRIGSDGVARWKREMTARDFFVAEAFMGAQLTGVGYERRYPGPYWASAFALTRLYCRTVLPAVDLQKRGMRFHRKRLGPRLGVN
jgi:hypothetical protein